MFRLTMKNLGQVTLVYAILLSIVGLALIAMNTYFRRGIQSGIKIAADEIGVQEEYESDPTKHSYGETRERRLSSIWRNLKEIVQEIGAVHALQVIETSQIYFRESSSWSGFEKD